MSYSMFDFIRKILPTNRPISRTLTRPNDLHIGDILTFGLLSQPSLSGKNFQVADIDTYDFKQGDFTVFTLEGDSGQPVYVSERSNEGERYLSIRQKIKRSTVDTLFGLENFSLIMNDSGVDTLDIHTQPSAYEGWLASDYHKVIDCRSGYRHKGDYRTTPIPQYEDESNGLDYYQLLDKSEHFGIEIEVFDNDETDVYLVIHHPLSAIEALWPGNMQS